MNLSHSQKKYLKKYLKKYPLEKISRDLKIKQSDLLSYLETINKDNNSENLNNFSFGKWFGNNYKSIIFLCLLVFTVYANSLFGDFLSDDFAAIPQNPLINHLSNFFLPQWPFFSPPNFFQSLIYILFGPTPFFYHLLSILFHLGSVLTIFLLADLFFAFPAGLFIAGFFSVHPLLTESVSWISAILYPLSSFFLLLSFLFYLIIKNHKGTFFSSFFFLIALSSNEKLFVFPLVLFLLEFSLGTLKENWRKLLPFFSLSALWAFLYFGVGRSPSGPPAFSYQEPGLNNPFFQVPIAVTSYLELLFFPLNLSFYHSEMSFTQNEFLLRLIIFIIFISFISYSFLKNKQIFFWLSFFLIMLSPTLNPFGIGWIVAERYVYLASLGIMAVIALSMKKIGDLLKNKNISYLLFAVLLLFLSIRTIMRNFDFQNQDNLWLATAKTSPHSAQNHNNLGDYYGRSGNLEKAAEEFKIAIKLLPKYADAYHNLGNTYVQMKKSSEAMKNFQKAASINPNLWQSYQNMAAIYFDRENYLKAAEMFEKAIKINPANSNLYTNLGIIKLKLNDKKEAQGAFLKALQLNPQDQVAQAGLQESSE